MKQCKNIKKHTNRNRKFAKMIGNNKILKLPSNCGKLRSNCGKLRSNCAPIFPPKCKISVPVGFPTRPITNLDVFLPISRIQIRFVWSSQQKVLLIVGMNTKCTLNGNCDVLRSLQELWRKPTTHPQVTSKPRIPVIFEFLHHRLPFLWDPAGPNGFTRFCDVYFF